MPKQGLIRAGLTALALLSSAALAQANVDAAGATRVQAAKAKAPDAKTPDAKALAAAMKKVVDINSASKAELARLPGIGGAEAERIIAGRPYGSKAFLVTRNIIPAGVYELIKYRIIARQK